MRLVPLSLVCLVLAGCAGNLADYVGPRSTIISPQLLRYGFDLAQSRCVGRQLANDLTPLQLRRFQRVAAIVRPGWSEPDRLTMRDLIHVAASIPDPAVRTGLDRAMQACGVAAAPSRVEVTRPLPPPPPPASRPRPPVWLNLGTAPTGQSIAVDAASLEQEAGLRTAWFRLTNPGEATPIGTSYRLRIDCPHRTIQSLAHRRQDASGAVVEQREYAPGEERPLPVEAGTVMEIAWLAMCT